MYYLPYCTRYDSAIIEHTLYHLVILVQVALTLPANVLLPTPPTAKQPLDLFLTLTSPLPPETIFLTAARRTGGDHRTVLTLP